ncbi:diguanylate cyclase (GGDEF) domain-containing protein [Desulforamulus aeronauticus DSM 10349]|uniref:Diguanylate cyclase (GGDEF) domain-containing protein n=1 Tax=Desulforamulus aeronauticus DSM 10349 TaxID=1121421 RepID=A0A1M6WMB8_9FIRM|nr:diguanylate cyclase (GGDEF) domain-containing protein [Desulforamulus aeronauticus DSM 10349]
MSLDHLEIQDVINVMSKFQKLFDIIRVVDPVKKRVVDYKEMTECGQGSICYDFWKTGVQCNNCVSARAMNENDTFIKVECNDGKLFLIIASPIKLGEDNYVVEMLKDITETGAITILKEKGIKETNNIIAELNEKSVTDELTGMYNRRYINERLPADIYTAILNQKKLSVIMLDIDYFKEINDNHGHIVGDTVIKELCKTMESKIRKNYDWVARYGGEEFLIVLMDANQDVAYKISEKIRLALANKPIKHNDLTIWVTVSVGNYTLEPGIKNYHEVLQAVDRNLYQAKKNGRNRTVSSHIE